MFFQKYSEISMKAPPMFDSDCCCHVSFSIFPSVIKHLLAYTTLQRTAAGEQRFSAIVIKKSIVVMDLLNGSLRIVSLTR